MKIQNIALVIVFLWHAEANQDFTGPGSVVCRSEDIIADIANLCVLTIPEPLLCSSGCSDNGGVYGTIGPKTNGDWVVPLVCSCQVATNCPDSCTLRPEGYNAEGVEGNLKSFQGAGIVECPLELAAAQFCNLVQCEDATVCEPSGTNFQDFDNAGINYLTDIDVIRYPLWDCTLCAEDCHPACSYVPLVIGSPTETLPVAPSSLAPTTSLTPSPSFPTSSQTTPSPNGSNVETKDIVGPGYIVCPLEDYAKAPCYPRDTDMNCNFASECLYNFAPITYTTDDGKIVQSIPCDCLTAENCASSCELLSENPASTGTSEEDGGDPIAGLGPNNFRGPGTLSCPITALVQTPCDIGPVPGVSEDECRSKCPDDAIKYDIIDSMTVKWTIPCDCVQWLGCPKECTFNEGSMSQNRSQGIRRAVGDSAVVIAVVASSSVFWFI